MADTTITAPATDEDRVIFYRLPAHAIEEGMSTADGQDVLSTSEWTTDTGAREIYLSVYTPADDEDTDAENRSESETRVHPCDALIHMATFTNSEVDGSSHDLAIPA